MGPNSPGLLHLLLDGLRIIAVLRKQAIKVFKHLDVLQHGSVDGKLAPQGKGRGASWLPLKPSIHPDPAFLCPYVSGYAGLTCIWHCSHQGKYPSIRTTTLLKGWRSQKWRWSIHSSLNSPGHSGTGQGSLQLRFECSWYVTPAHGSR